MSRRLLAANEPGEPTRRQMLGGSLATAGLLLVPLPRVTQGPMIPASHPVFGMNSRQWSSINSALGGRVRGERCYAPPRTGTDGVPAHWFRAASSVRRLVGSFKPNVSAVLSGKLDAELHALAHQVPSPHIVTAWHEGEEPNSGSGFTAAQLQAFHAHVAPIFKNAGKKYVQILGSYSIHTRGKELPAWVSPHVDAVYLDGYQRVTGVTPHDIFSPMEEAITKAVGKKMPRGITETNSAFPSKRPAWFGAAWNYAMENHHEVFLTFWNADFPWLAGDHATITKLRSISQTA
jgi:hypothetical protein